MGECGCELTAVRHPPLQAWDDSYSSWRSLTSLLINYQGEETSPPPDFLAELVARASKRYSTPAITIEGSDENIQVTPCVLR